jgi:hypothetical protein
MVLHLRGEPVTVRLAPDGPDRFPIRVSTVAVPANGARRRPSAWAWLVTVSAVLVLGSALTFAIWWLATSERAITSYAVQGSINAIQLDLGGAAVDIVGGGESMGVQVRRTDDFAFGHQAASVRGARAGVLSIGSRCPATVLGSCAASYRLTVPDNVRVTIRTTSGRVRLFGYRGSADVDTGSGDISISGVCGFGLRARSQSGDVSASAACALERMELRSGTGNVTATVPAGRYQVDADTDTGRREVRGVTAADDAPFQIQALSSGGNVTVEAAE